MHGVAKRSVFISLTVVVAAGAVTGWLVSQHPNTGAPSAASPSPGGNGCADGLRITGAVNDCLSPVKVEVCEQARNDLEAALIVRGRNAKRTYTFAVSVHGTLSTLPGDWGLGNASAAQVLLTDSRTRAAWQSTGGTLTVYGDKKSGFVAGVLKPTIGTARTTSADATVIGAWRCP